MNTTTTENTIIPRNLIEGANNNSFFNRGSGLERDAQNESNRFEGCEEIKRLEQLKKHRAIADEEKAEGLKLGTMEKEGLRLEENHEAARVQLFFDGKPDEQTRATLKANGFRWSPRFGAWQRQNTPNGLAIARRFFESYKAA